MAFEKKQFFFCSNLYIDPKSVFFYTVEKGLFVHVHVHFIPIYIYILKCTHVCTYKRIIPLFKSSIYAIYKKRNEHGASISISSERDRENYN